jgi:hypothetical protein
VVAQEALEGTRGASPHWTTLELWQRMSVIPLVPKLLRVSHLAMSLWPACESWRSDEHALGLPIPVANRAHSDSRTSQSVCSNRLWD